MNDVPSEAALGLIASHYADSVECVRRAETARGRFTVLMLATFAAMLLCWSEPVRSTDFTGEVLAKKLEVGQFVVPLPAIQASLLILLAILVFRLFQLDVFVEKSYPYIHDLEGTLQRAIGDKTAFGREGKHYDDQFCRFRWLAWVFYKWLLPVGTVGGGIAFGVTAQISAGAWTPCFYLDWLAMLALAISGLLYLLDIHKEPPEP